jgi:signal peptidase I
MENQTEAIVFENPWVFPNNLSLTAHSSSKQHKTASAAKQPKFSAFLGILIASCVVYLAVVFPLCIYQGVTGTRSFYGVYLVTVTSESMEPVLHDKSLHIGRREKFEKLSVGEIVVYNHPDGVRVVHRIVQKYDTFIIVRGDANSAPDDIFITPDMVVCRVLV